MVASQARPAYIYDTTLGDWVPMSGVVDTGQAYTFAAHQTFNGGIGATSTLDLKTGGTTRLSIDSSGRATLPYQPGFLATRSSNTAIGAGGAIPPYDTVTYDSRCHNVGNHYNISTYAFTAPVSGRYLFSHNSNVYSTTGVTFTTGIQINGSIYVNGTRFATNVSGDNDGTVSVILNLAANDYVKPYINVSSAMTISASPAWSSFSGVLLA